MAQMIVSCAFFMGFVAWTSYVKTRGEVATKDGYFLAGRGLTAVFIAGSMLLTNLSAEQLIGLNGSAYGFNLSSMGWEVTAAVASVFMAFLFLPRYLAGAFSTLPEFLNDRFDGTVRALSAVLFMVGYGLITILRAVRRLHRRAAAVRYSRIIGAVLHPVFGGDHRGYWHRGGLRGLWRA